MQQVNRAEGFKNTYVYFDVLLNGERIEKPDLNLNKKIWRRFIQELHQICYCI
jgi:hypothetical protein